MDNSIRIGAVCWLVFLGSMTGCLQQGPTVYYEGNAQLELISSLGRRVLIDIYDPALLSKPASDSDILLITHRHSDHYDRTFCGSFQGKRLFVEEGDIAEAGLSIRSIFAAHNEGDPYLAKYGSNYMLIIDIDGMRVVHFGDLGQEALSPEQVLAVGEADLAVMQFDNHFSDMDLQNKKGFKLMNQVKPRLMIATHFSDKAAEYSRSLWPCRYSTKTSITLAEQSLPKATELLLLGTVAEKYARVASATRW